MFVPTNNNSKSNVRPRYIRKNQNNDYNNPKDKQNVNMTALQKLQALYQSKAVDTKNKGVKRLLSSGSAVNHNEMLKKRQTMDSQSSEPNDHIQTKSVLSQTTSPDMEMTSVSNKVDDDNGSLIQSNSVDFNISIDTQIMESTPKINN